MANLFPFDYSGKADPNGFYIGKDKFGSNIVVDFDRRESDKTSANILILGNSGQGKSYLMKLLICNLIESGKSVISLDAEHELGDLCGNLNGCFIDLMAGELPGIGGFRNTPLGIELCQHDFNGVQLGIREILVSAEEVLQK